MFHRLKSSQNLISKQTSTASSTSSPPSSSASSSLPLSSLRSPLPKNCLFPESDIETLRKLMALYGTSSPSKCTLPPIRGSSSPDHLVSSDSSSYSNFDEDNVRNQLLILESIQMANRS